MINRRLGIGLSVAQLIAIVLVLLTDSVAVDLVALVVIATALAVQIKEFRTRR